MTMGLTVELNLYLRHRLRDIETYIETITNVSSLASFYRDIRLSILNYLVMDNIMRHVRQSLA